MFDTKNGYTIWAIDRLEAKPERLLDIEGQLAEAAAHRVRGELTVKERDLFTKSRATNAEAVAAVNTNAGAPSGTVWLLVFAYCFSEDRSLRPARTRATS